jgi:predicted enzyme related to lactoylglutathione lyase
MAEFTVPKHGTICWRELATKDLAAAKNFYKEMFGWDLEQSKVTSLDYSEIHIDDAAVGGMMAIDASWRENPPPSHWSAYVAVDNADETVEKIKTNGGSVSVGPFDAPGVGRIARAGDPAGAQFYVIQFAAAG